MIVANDDLAIRWLKSVSYYRLSAYCHPFKQPDSAYVPGTNFDSVQMLYGFDRRLRLLLLDAIERIEVALRTGVTYQLAINHGPFGHCNASHFSTRFDHDRLMQELSDKEDSREAFVDHFRKKYREEAHLPIWMASELMSMGTISRVYEALHPRLRRQIAIQLNTTDPYLISWSHTLSYVRNLCAHHSRVWNRRLAISPKLPPLSSSWPYRIDEGKKIYSVFIIAHHVLSKIAPHATWTARLMDLMNDYPNIPTSALGMPADWRSHNPWPAVTAAQAEAMVGDGSSTDGQSPRVPSASIDSA
jgi:abortive infection bacteriophage resistance protein